MTPMTPMDREALKNLIDHVNQNTAGNRHDYLTRGDVEQIINATLEALEHPGTPDPKPDPPEPSGPKT